MVMENKQKKGKGLIIIIIIILAVIGLIYYLFGIRGFLRFFKWFIIALLILGILGTLFYFIWYFFFKKQKFDITYVNKQRLLDACHKGYVDVLKGLYLSGDKGHSRTYWGKITGYARISVLTRSIRHDEEGEEVVITDEKTSVKTLVYDFGHEEQDVFSISHSKNWIGRLFEEEDVVRVSPELHDELVGDVVLYGFSLLPMSEYWFLNSDLLDVRKIDFAILKEAERGIMFEMLRDSKEIIDKASGLDADHQKRIEEKSQFELPVNVGK